MLRYHQIVEPQNFPVSLSSCARVLNRRSPRNGMYEIINFENCVIRNVIKLGGWKNNNNSETKTKRSKIENGLCALETVMKGSTPTQSVKLRSQMQAQSSDKRKFGSNYTYAHEFHLMKVFSFCQQKSVNIHRHLLHNFTMSNGIFNFSVFATHKDTDRHTRSTFRSNAIQNSSKHRGTLPLQSLCRQTHHFTKGKKT